MQIKETISSDEVGMLEDILPAETLMDSLLSEIERCSKLKAMYDEVPTGAFGALVIQQAIDNAKAAISSGDIEQMIDALRVCEGCK